MPDLPISHVRILAQQDPVPTITARYGETIHTARTRVAQLTDTLRELDQIAAQLAERGVTVTADLGPVGDAAASTRRDLERDTGRTFAMPRSA